MGFEDLGLGFNVGMVFQPWSDDQGSKIRAGQTIRVRRLGLGVTRVRRSGLGGDRGLKIMPWCDQG